MKWYRYIPITAVAPLIHAISCFSFLLLTLLLFFLPFVVSTLQLSSLPFLSLPCFSLYRYAWINITGWEIFTQTKDQMTTEAEVVVIVTLVLLSDNLYQQNKTSLSHCCWLFFYTTLSALPLSLISLFNFLCFIFFILSVSPFSHFITLTLTCNTFTS